MKKISKTLIAAKLSKSTFRKWKTSVKLMYAFKLKNNCELSRYVCANKSRNRYHHVAKRKVVDHFKRKRGSTKLHHNFT